MIKTNVIEVKRLAIPDPISTFDIPDKVSAAVIKNVGTKDMKFNFDGDFDTHYWTLKIGEQTPVMEINPSRTFHTDGIGGSTTIEVLMWG